MYWEHVLIPLHFLASKGTKTTTTQAASHTKRMQIDQYTKCLGSPTTRQSCTENYLKTGLHFDHSHCHFGIHQNR